jgi:hypothetical protein
MATRRLVAVEVFQLPQTKAPPLPLAPTQYDRAYHDTVNNILRQYFVTLDNFTNLLFVNDVYTVATLPSATTQGVGARAFVTDSSVTTFRSVVAGGGSTAVPVFSDGTNWRVG